MLSRYLLLAGFALAAQAQQTGPQIATFFSAIDNSQQPYALYVPPSLNPDRKYPLVISLHSEESNHRLNLRQIFGVSNRFGATDPPNMKFFPVVRDREVFVACPLARGTMGYRGIPEQDVYDVLAEVERRYPIDPDRVYLTGISMGGGGALWMASTRPDVWAAVAPLCPAAPPGAEELAGNLLDLPIHLFHGDLDPIVPAASSRAWQRRLLDLGVPASYSEYPGVRHNAWDPAYKDGSIFDWFEKFQRVRTPERVRFATRSFRYHSAYWIRIDGFPAGALASIDARRNGAEVRVETRDVDGFSLVGTFSPAPSTVMIDGAAVRVKPGSALAFVKTGGHWRAGRAPSPTAEGPIAQAVSSRHLYVYGSLATRTADELEARHRIAETAAAWSTQRAPLALSLPVKADSQVTAEDLESADLILFGNANTNSLIGRFASQLPLALNAGAADYGLLFLAPIGKHLVLVSSGLPWWIGGDDANRGGDPFAPAQYRLLSTFGDFILFKGSVVNSIAEGRFDRNWKLPPDAAAKMAATGTVTIR